MNDLYSREGTSYEAAVSVRDHTPSLRDQALALIRYAQADGMTDEEIGAHLQIGLNTARPRRYELERMGLIVDSGQRRRTKSGRNAIVWCVVEPEGQGRLL